MGDGDLLSWITPAPGGFITPIASLIAVIVTARIAVAALKTAAAVNLRNKRVDVISSCNARYDALAQTKTAIIKSIIMLPNPDSDKFEREKRAIEYEIDLYHRRYWGLKSDQIDCWLAGYIDPETLISWFMSTADAIHNPIDIWNDFQQTDMGGWESVQAFHRVTNPRLHQIVTALSRRGIKRKSPNWLYAYIFAILCGIEAEEESLITMLTRDDHARLSMTRFKPQLPPAIAAFVEAWNFNQSKNGDHQLDERRRWADREA